MTDYFIFIKLLLVHPSIQFFICVIIITESLISSENEPQKQVVEENNDYLKLHAKPTEENIGNDESEELNPEEWDPW